MKTHARTISQGERADWLVEKSAEVGVDSIRPLLTEHAVLLPSQARIDRLSNLGEEDAQIFFLGAPPTWAYPTPFSVSCFSG